MAASSKEHWVHFPEPLVPIYAQVAQKYRSYIGAARQIYNSHIGAAQRGADSAVEPSICIALCLKRSQSRRMEIAGSGAHVPRCNVDLFGARGRNSDRSQRVQRRRSKSDRDATPVVGIKQSQSVERRLRSGRGRSRRRAAIVAAQEQRLHRGHHDQHDVGPINIPPTTTVASGRCTWLPMPVDTAAGSKPMQADKRRHQHRPHALLGGVEHRFDRCPCRRRLTSL